MSKLTFRERVFRAYAAVMRTLFPTYCVKKKTLKRKNYYGTWGSTRNYDGEMFLPGKEKELQAIEKLQFDEYALNARYWSLATKIALLKKRNFSMVQRIKTESELDAVVETGDVAEIIEAMRVCTPSKKYLLSLIKHWDREKLLTVISGVSSAFDALLPYEVLGVGEKEAYEGKEMWAVAQALVKADPEKWAMKFINEVMKVVPSKLNDEALETLSVCVYEAMEKKVNISESIAYLMVLNRPLYTLVRSSLANAKDTSLVVPYVEKLFPQLIEKLTGDLSTLYSKNGPSAWSCSMEELTDEQEAFIWLLFALRPATIELVIDHLSEIKAQVSEHLFSQVVDDVLSFASSVSEITKLMNIYKKDAEKLVLLRNNLLKVIGNKDRGVLKKYSPFDGWTDEQKEKAVRAMAVGKTLPEDLSVLPEKLQEVAVEELEIQSEIAIICEGACGEKEALMKRKLYPRSEGVLFSHYYGTLESYAPQYIQNHCMSESAFKSLISHTRDSKGYDIERYVSKLVKLHAEKWGLSEKNYKDLMQSECYSSLAAVLKKYCLVEGNRQPDFEDGV